MGIICQRVLAEAFNLLYGTRLNGPGCAAEELLVATARIRGFTTAHGNQDEARVAKIVRKDFVGRQMIHCELPPGLRLRQEEVGVTVEPLAPAELELPAVALPAERRQKPVSTEKPKRRQVVRFTSSLD
jgi:hypothetical protein